MGEKTGVQKTWVEKTWEKKTGGQRPGRKVLVTAYLMWEGTSKLIEHTADRISNQIFG